MRYELLSMDAISNLFNAWQSWAAAVHEHDDERVFVGVFQCGPQNQSKGSHGALGAIHESR